MHLRLSFVVAALVAPTLAFGGATALPLAPCAAPSPLSWLQDDAGSGRDAGDQRNASAPLSADGWSFAALTVPVETGVDDLHDWFVADVPAGLHEVTIDLQNVPNLLLNMGNQVPLILYMEVWTQGGEIPAFEFASWAQPVTFPSDGGRHFVHVYPSPLMLVDACAPGAGDPVPVGAMPMVLQTYGVRFECLPHCFG